MTEIIMTADKKAHIVDNEKSYCGESKPDVFRILVPITFNGIYSRNSRITFNYITPMGEIGMILLNEIGEKTSRLANYYVFEFRMESRFYKNNGNVKCWLQFENENKDICIKSECCSIAVCKHH